MIWIRFNGCFLSPASRAPRVDERPYHIQGKGRNLPGERRDPGATEHWVATRRTSNHHGLRGTEGAVLSKSPRTTIQRKAHCAEARLVTAAPSRFLGLSLSYLLVFPAKAGIQGPRSIGRQPKGHRVTKGSAARRVLFFKRAQVPCRRKAHCAEVRAVAAAPPRLLGPRFRGGNEWGMNPSIVPVEGPLRSGPASGCGTTAAPGPSLSHPSFSRRTPGPRDHGALGGSQKDIRPPRFPQHGACCSFKKSQASCRRNIRCAEVRFVAAAPPRLLGPRFRGGNEWGMNPSIVPVEGPLR